MAYNFDKKLDDGTYTIEVDTAAKYGHFEHNRLGEDRAGGLWFAANEKGELELADYDGVSELPAKVFHGLCAMGFTVDVIFLD